MHPAKRAPSPVLESSPPISGVRLSRPGASEPGPIAGAAPGETPLTEARRWQATLALLGVLAVLVLVSLLPRDRIPSTTTADIANVGASVVQAR